jgi:hypothetical protein
MRMGDIGMKSQRQKKIELDPEFAREVRVYRSHKAYMEFLWLLRRQGG